MRRSLFKKIDLLETLNTELYYSDHEYLKYHISDRTKTTLSILLSLIEILEKERFSKLRIHI